MSTATLENSSRTPEPPAVGVPPLASGSAPAFVRDVIEKRLAEMRRHCAILKEGVRHAQDPKSYCGTDSGTSTYWRDLKAKCAAERPVEYAAALKELADFIAEHRPLMGPDWIGDDHGRQCWAPYLGGMPIGQHYCEREEGHTGPHRCTRGAWPQGVDCSAAWHRLLATLPKGATGLEEQNEKAQPLRAAGAEDSTKGKA